jgi:hypothetical protein
MAVDKKDIRRWVIVTLRNNGATEAQFPLPVTHNGIRVVLERDVPAIIPAFFLEIVKAATLPRYEKATSVDQGTGKIRSTDDVILKPISYSADALEIPMEYQTLEGIEKLEGLLASPATAPAGFDHVVGAKIGTRETPPHSIAWDMALKAQQKPEPAVKGK